MRGNTTKTTTAAAAAAALAAVLFSSLLDQSCSFLRDTNMHEQKKYMGYPAYDITNTSKRAKTYMNMHDAGSENDVVLNTNKFIKLLALIFDR